MSQVSPSACVTALIALLKSVMKVGCIGNSVSIYLLQNQDTSWPNSPWPSKHAIIRDEECSQCFISNESWLGLCGLFGAGQGNRKEKRIGRKIRFGGGEEMNRSEKNSIE